MADPEKLRIGKLYPVAPDAKLPAGYDRGTTRVRATGEFRPPRKGEFYLSGAIIEGYSAPNDLSRAFRIGELVKGEMVWREVTDAESGK